MVLLVSAPFLSPGQAWGSYRHLVPFLLVHVVMTAIKNYQTSFLTFELCTPLTCRVLHLHYCLREGILCSVTSHCETHSLIKKDIYCSLTHSTLTPLNSKTNRCKIHTVVKKGKKNAGEVPTLNCREFSSPRLQNSSDEKSFKLFTDDDHRQMTDGDHPVVLQ